MRFTPARAGVLVVAVLALAGAATGATNPPRFIEPMYSAGGAHPTSGLAGFPARDYMSRGGALVRAPFSGCVPTSRPWGRLAHQSPTQGFGGSRIYLERTKTGDQAYLAHFGLNSPYGDLYLKPGDCFRQGDPVGTVWGWPGNPGRSHIHAGYQGGDPLYKLVGTDGTFRIVEGPVWHPGPGGSIFPRPILRHEGKHWRVQVGERRVYQGGEEKAREVYNVQKLARTINLHFKHTYARSPLVGWGLQMVRLSRAQDIDPRLPAAIASCETSGGTNGSGPAVNNDFGLLVRGGDHRHFKSRRKAIAYLARLLDEKYIGLGLDTIAEIGAKYAPAGGVANDPHRKNDRWVGCVTKVYVDLHGTRFLVAFPELHKTDSVAKSKHCPEPGRWQVTRQGVVVFQCKYRPALDFYRDKLAWAERKNGVA